MASNAGASIAVGFLALIIGLAGIILPESASPPNYSSYQKVLTGTLAERPSANITDRWFYATDEGKMYFDNSTVWLEITTSPISHETTHLAGGSDYFAHKHRLNWGGNNNHTETSTHSTNYVLLQSATITLMMDFSGMVIFWTHNVKNEGELATRGATFKLTYQKSGGSEYTLAEYRWTDALNDYKCMSIAFYTLSSSGTYTFRIYWKVDDSSYACWSKTRTLIVHEFVTFTEALP